MTLQQPRQTAAARSSSADGQENQSGSTEAASKSGDAAGINTAASYQERVPAAAAGLPAAANEQFQDGQALLDGLTAFYKAQGEQAPHIIKCGTVATYEIHELLKQISCTAQVHALRPVETCLQAHEAKLSIRLTLFRVHLQVPHLPEAARQPAQTV